MACRLSRVELLNPLSEVKFTHPTRGGGGEVVNPMEAAKLHREAAAVAQSLEGGGSGSAGSTGWRMRRGGRMVGW